MRKRLRLSFAKTTQLLRDRRGIRVQVCLETQACSSISLTSWYWLLQVTVSRLIGHLENETWTEQRVQRKFDLPGILGWFQEGGGRGNCIWPKGSQESDGRISRHLLLRRQSGILVLYFILWIIIAITTIPHTTSQILFFSLSYKEIEA